MESKLSRPTSGEIHLMVVIGGLLVALLLTGLAVRIHMDRYTSLQAECVRRGHAEWTPDKDFKWKEAAELIKGGVR